MDAIKDVGKGYYCDVFAYGLKECVAMGRKTCVGCGWRRRKFKKKRS